VKLRIGTRGSRLALAQAREVADALSVTGVETELVTITTAGDRGADPASDPAGVKGLFVIEIVRALLVAAQRHRERSQAPHFGHEGVS